MNCVEWEERIALYAGGDELDAVAVERHLAGCPECHEFAAGLRESLAILRETHQEELPAALLTAVRTRVLGQLAAQRRPVWRRTWVYGVAAAVLAIAVVAGAWIRPSAPPAPPVVAVATPPAPKIERIIPRPPAQPRMHVLRTAKTEPLMIRIVTDDPDIVLYWIADKKGDY